MFEIEIAVVDALERSWSRGRRFGTTALVYGVALSHRRSGSMHTTSPRWLSCRMSSTFRSRSGFDVSFGTGSGRPPLDAQIRRFVGEVS
jgi:hypothetical protein